MFHVLTVALCWSWWKNSMPLLYDLSYLEDSAMNFPGVSFEFRCALSALDLLLSQTMYFSIGEALHIPLRNTRTGTLIRIASPSLIANCGI
jgi:hypothetical protein